MADRRPIGWKQWAEVVPRDPVKARFIGDMPHAWVGSDFIRATLDRLAYADEAREALVLAAGVPESWLAAGEQIGVDALGTPYGVLSYSTHGGVGEVRIHVEGGIDMPPGGVVLAMPFPIASATVNGLTVVPEPGRQITVPPAGELVLWSLPVEVVLHRLPAAQAK